MLCSFLFLGLCLEFQGESSEAKDQAPWLVDFWTLVISCDWIETLKFESGKSSSNSFDDANLLSFVDLCCIHLKWEN